MERKDCVPAVSKKSRETNSLPRSKEEGDMQDYTAVAFSGKEIRKVGYEAGVSESEENVLTENRLWLLGNWASGFTYICLENVCQAWPSFTSDA